MNIENEIIELKKENMQLKKFIQELAYLMRLSRFDDNSMCEEYRESNYNDTIDFFEKNNIVDINIIESEIEDELSRIIKENWV